MFGNVDASRPFTGFFGLCYDGGTNRYSINVGSTSVIILKLGLKEVIL